MVYEWEPHRETCYRLYIEEKKPLEDLIEYMRVHHDFTPSKRAYQTQFRRWAFPPKQSPAHRDAALVARVRALWERNLSQREMLRMLAEEDGFAITQRELVRVRARHGWLLRVPNSDRSGDASVVRRGGGEAGRLAPEEEEEEEEGEQQLGQNGGGAAATDEQQQRRERRRRGMEAESAARYASRKRRRRTRAYAGLPADPAGPPRFPSETTLEEGRAALGLGDRGAYARVRARFREICGEMGVERKTVAGPARWEEAKERLVAGWEGLVGVGWSAGDGDGQGEGGSGHRKVALDVLCTDVTKRMRAEGEGVRRLTVGEAKNALGMNPDEARQVRRELYGILEKHGFAGKLEDGPERWEELKRLWLDRAAVVKARLAEAGTEAVRQRMTKAVDALARDVVKRFRDDQTRRDPGGGGRRTAEVAAAAAAGAEAVQIEVTPAEVAALTAAERQDLDAERYVSHISPGVGAMPPRSPHHLQGHSPHMQTHLLPLDPHAGGLAMDPELGGAGAGSFLMPPDSPAGGNFVDGPGAYYAAAPPPTGLFHQPQRQHPRQRHPSTHQQHQHQHQHQHHMPTSPTPTSPPLASTPIAIFLRLHPSSVLPPPPGPPAPPPGPWIEMLAAPTPSMAELQRAAMRRFAPRGVVCTAVDGLLRTESGGAGVEVPLRIRTDGELAAYLGSVFLGAGPPSFVVRIQDAGGP